MKVAVISDIHSNYVALEKCVNYAVGQGVRDFLFLGDYIGELGYPEKTMELLARYRERYHCVFIRGNKENYWLQRRGIEQKNWREYDSTTGALYYAYQRLTEEDLDFFATLPTAKRVEFDGLPALMICHGSPRNVREEVRPGQDNVMEILEETKEEYILCGHTHEQMKFTHKNRTIVNPGSVGLALKAGGKAEFMILTGENGQWKEEFISLNYDKERVINELYTSGLYQRAPFWSYLTKRLILSPEGEEIRHADVLCRAMELCRQQTGSCVWPEIPELYWEQAVDEYLKKVG